MRRSNQKASHYAVFSVQLSPKYVSQQPVFKHPYLVLALNVADLFTPICNNMQVLYILIRIYLKSA